MGIVVVSATIAEGGRVLDEDASNTLQYVSSKGYVLQVPEHWIVIDSEGKVLAKEMLKQYWSQFDIDFNDVDIDALMYRDTVEEFPACLYVNVLGGRASVSNRTEISERIQQQFRSMGLTLRDFTNGVVHFANRDCLAFSGVLTVEDQEISFTGYMVPGNGVTYEVAGFAKEANQGDYYPVLQEVMRSFRVTGWGGLPEVPQWALIAAGIILAWAWQSHSKRRASSSHEKSTTATGTRTNRRADKKECIAQAVEKGDDSSIAEWSEDNEPNEETPGHESCDPNKKVRRSSGKSKRRVSSLAVFSLLLCFFPYFGLPMALLSLRRIAKSKSRLCGRTLAWISLVINGVFLVLLLSV
ncbi:MAG: DUF4190 domain-containing protein [Phycisphaerae bacterium]|nr:DUF4190 domain-containing protein [Phycisphaerae bacterium]